MTDPHSIKAVKEALASGSFPQVCDLLEAMPPGPLRADLVAYADRVMDATWGEKRSYGWNWPFWQDIPAGRCWLPLVRDIEVERNTLGEDGLRALVTCRALARLRSLALFRVREIRDEQMHILGDPGVFPRLTRLDLSENHITGRGVSALFGRGFGRSLRDLHLANNPLGPEGARALARSASLRVVRSLNLNGSKIGAKGAAALGGRMALRSLRELRLHYCDLGDRGAAALGRDRLFRRLHHLDLGENGIGAPGAAALARALSARSAVQTLDLSENPLGSEGAARLAAAPLSPALRRLDLRGTGLNDRDAMALWWAPWWPQLETLSLGGDGISSAVLEMVAKSPR